MRKIAIIAVLIICCSTVRATAVRIIPVPNSVTSQKGSVSLKDGVMIAFDVEATDAATYCGEVLKNDFNIEPRDGSKTKICFIEDDKLPIEAYKLVVGRDGVTITAGSHSGYIYGVQSLRQLLDPATLTVGAVVIEDSPRFGWRAFMLDDARFFHGVEYVESILESMSQLKMNRFHWHLTDDQGWRLEIQKYPALTSVGAFRDSTEQIDYGSGVYDGKPHGGFYTKADVARVVEFARVRGIEIVPEIEMPGHATAAIAAYPWLGMTGEKIAVTPNFGVLPWVFNVADSTVVAFLQDVLRETAAMFPFGVIHIGGDEVKSDQWRQSEQITQLMERRRLKNYSEVQLDFSTAMSQYVQSLGKRMMGWNEIMGRNIHEWSTDQNAQQSSSLSLARNSIIHFWKGDTSYIREALERGFDVVNSIHTNTYLNYSLQKLPLSMCYDFEPIPTGLSPELAAKVIGIGCQMWCVWFQTPSAQHSQIFPRIAAFAEVGWSSVQNRDFASFSQSLCRSLRRPRPF